MLPPRDYFFATLATLFPAEFEALLQRVVDRKDEERAAGKRYEMTPEMRTMLETENDLFGYLKNKSSEIYLHVQRRLRGW